MSLFEIKEYKNNLYTYYTNALFTYTNRNDNFCFCRYQKRIVGSLRIQSKIVALAGQLVHRITRIHGGIGESVPHGFDETLSDSWWCQAVQLGQILGRQPDLSTGTLLFGMKELHKKASNYVKRVVIVSQIQVLGPTRHRTDGKWITRSL